MLRWLERVMPHAGVDGDNPLFKYEVRRIRWGKSAEQLNYDGLRVLVSVLILIGCLWFLLIKPSSNFVTSRAYSLLEANGEFIGILLFASIAVDIVVDFVCIVAVLNVIEGEIEHKRWDLLNLTYIYPQGIVDSKFAVAQIYCWRILAISIGVRTAVTSLLFLHMILLAYYDEINNSPGSLCLVNFVHLLFIPYIVEPLWRMRAFLAIALSVRARVHIVVFAILASVRIISSFEIIRIILMALIALTWLQSIKSGDNEGVVLTVFCSPPLTLSFGVVSYFVYRQLKIWGLQKAVEHFSVPN